MLQNKEKQDRQMDIMEGCKNLNLGKKCAETLCLSMLSGQFKHIRIVHDSWLLVLVEVYDKNCNYSSKQCVCSNKIGTTMKQKRQ